jgi:hypothetical protein
MDEIYLKSLFRDYKNKEPIYKHDTNYDKFPNNLSKDSIFLYNAKNVVHWIMRFNYLKEMNLLAKTMKNEGAEKEYNNVMGNNQDYKSYNKMMYKNLIHYKNNKTHTLYSATRSAVRLSTSKKGNSSVGQSINGHISFKLIPNKNFKNIYLLKILEINSNNNLNIFFWKFMKSLDGSPKSVDVIVFDPNITNSHVKKLSEYIIINGSDNNKIKEYNIYKFNNKFIWSNYKILDKSLVVDTNISFGNVYVNNKKENNPNATTMIKTYLKNILFKLSYKMDNEKQCMSKFKIVLYNPEDNIEKNIMDIFWEEIEKEKKSNPDKKVYIDKDKINTYFALYIYDKISKKICSVGVFQILEFANIYDPSQSRYIDVFKSPDVNFKNSVITDSTKWIYLSDLHTLDQYTTKGLEKLFESYNFSSLPRTEEEKKNNLTFASLLTFIIFKYATLIKNRFFDIAGVGTVPASEGTRIILERLFDLNFNSHFSKYYTVEDEIDKLIAKLYNDINGLMNNYKKDKRTVEYIKKFIQLDKKGVINKPFDQYFLYNAQEKSPIIIDLILKKQINNDYAANINGEKMKDFINAEHIFLKLKKNKSINDYENLKNDYIEKITKIYEKKVINNTLVDFYNSYRSFTHFYFYSFMGNEFKTFIKPNLDKFEKIIRNNCGLYYQKISKKKNIKKAFGANRKMLCAACYDKNPKFMENDQDSLFFCNYFCQQSFYH